MRPVVYVKRFARRGAVPRSGLLLSSAAVIGACLGAQCPGVCERDAQCDDGLFCNGAETCGEGMICVGGVSPCADVATCDEQNRACIECFENADCGDMDACTTDRCVDGACTNVAVDCDDGDPCTVDSCVEATGNCRNDPIECPSGQTCSGGVCVAATP